MCVLEIIFDLPFGFPINNIIFHHVCVCVYSPASIGSLSLFSSCFKLFLRIWSHSLPSADCVEFDSRILCHLWRTNLELSISALQTSLCSFPPHTPFWSWCKHHCWFPSKLVSVPEALKVEIIQSLKESSLRASPSFDDCHFVRVCVHACV